MTDNPQDGLPPDYHELVNLLASDNANNTIVFEAADGEHIQLNLGEVPGVQMQVPQVEHIDYNVEVVVDTDNPNVGRCIYDPDKHVLTAYLHDGYTAVQVNDELVQKYINKQRYSLPLSQTVGLNINPVELRTCVNFSAHRDAVEADGSVVSISRRFDYDRVFTEASCSSPKRANVIESYACPYVQQQATCPIYEPEHWIKEKGYKSSSEDKEWYLESIRKGIGFKYYRVVVIDNKTSEQDTLFEVNVVENPQEAEILSHKALNTVIDGIADAVEIPLGNQEDVKQTYYEYAFSS